MTDEGRPEVYIRVVEPGQPVSPDLLGPGRWLLASENNIVALIDAALAVKGGNSVPNELDFVLFVWSNEKFAIVCAPGVVHPDSVPVSWNEVALIKLAAVRE